MKYNILQYNNLVECLTILSKFFDLNTLAPINLHFLVYQQYNEGQKHNRLIVNNGKLTRKFSLIGDQLKENEGENLNFPLFDFQLYPEGCNDTHVETAVKKAIKQVYENTI